MKNLLYGMMILLLSGGNIFSASVTGTGATSLMFDAMGSRSLSLKESVTAIATGPEAINANPALIANIDRLNLSLMYLKWFADMSFLYFASALPLPIANFNGKVGIAITTFSSGEFDKMIEGSSSAAGKTSANDFNIALSYAQNIDKDIQAGANIKIIRSTLDEYSATSIGLDLGATYNLDSQIGIPILGAVAVQNIGTSQKFVSTGTPLPMNIKVGFGYNYLLMKNHNILGDIDFNFPNDSDIIARIGIEYSYISKVKNLKLLSVRMGFQPMGRKNNLFSIGVGSELPLADYGLKDYQITLDYAMVPISDMGYNHAITLTVKFKNEISTLFMGEGEKEKVIKQFDNEIKQEDTNTEQTNQ